MDSVLEPTIASVAKRALMREGRGRSGLSMDRKPPASNEYDPEPVCETAALIPVNSWPT